MKNFAILIFAVHIPCVLISQINAFYTNLNFSNCTSGFFWDEFRSGNYPPEVDTYSYLTGEEAAQYFMLFREKHGAHFWSGEANSNHFFRDVTHGMAIPAGPVALAL